MTLREGLEESKMARQASARPRLKAWTGRVRPLIGAVAIACFATQAAAAGAAKGGAKGTKASAAGTADAGAAPASSASAAGVDGGVSAASAASSATPPTGADGGAAAPAPTDTASASTAAPAPTFKPHAPPLPPPTPTQLAAFDALRQEAQAYERGAKDYKDTITTLVTLHYEQKKQSILGGLDNEIGIEKDELKKARENAINRLKAFVDLYSGANAQPDATPDAMYRLAALYEERARSDDDPNSDLAVGLKPAVALYKRVIHDFPSYAELAGIYYFLGHALNDSRRVDEALQVWRSLVCHNKYPYPTPPDPKNPDADTVGSMPQDHDTAYWNAWRNKYPRPESIKKGPKDDVTFDDPYPNSCVMVAQPSILAGQEPKYIAEVWWRIGDWEFDQLDTKGGVVDFEPYAVWDYNRAASAYTHSMQFKNPPLFGVALYKYAWTLFKQQRYEAATHEFVHLLNYTDEQEKLTGDPGADFRSEAFTYIAGSLDNFDFVGPQADEPYIARPDILETAKSPAEAETKLRIAIDRVQDARLIPQDKPWSIEIYKALALEFRTINQYQNALAVYQTMLTKWPMDPSAPDTQASIAEVYELLVQQTKVGDQRHEYEAKVLEARTALAKYIGDTPWVDANKDNPQALQRAEELVKTGLKGAAITHTRNGQSALEQADQTNDGKEKLRLTTYAIQEYKLASIGWLGYLKQDENAPDAYKSRYFYADALHNEVRLEVALHAFDPKQFSAPTSQEIQAAEQAAVDVRDSDEDDQFIDNAGLFVVDLADVDRDIAFQRFQDSGGTQGIELRKEPKLEGPDDAKKVVTEEIPGVIQQSMKARDEYVERVPPERDKQNRSLDYGFYVADQYYLYGHFKEARERFQTIFNDQCQKSPLGYEAWKRLLVMSNMENNADLSRKLAESEANHSCAMTEAEKKETKDFTNTVLQNAAFSDANAVFEKAKATAPGPEQDALWRKAGQMYEDALKAAPAHKDAPAAAINSAFCYKQVGEFNRAIDDYNLFISNYGNEELLTRLDKGGKDPKDPNKGNQPPNPAEYKDRIKYLGMAYDALSTTYYGFFAYQKAAESFGKIATNTRFDDARRANASHIAMVLYSNLGDRTNMDKMYAISVDPKMNLTGSKRAEADYLKASFDYGQWNPNGSDSGANASARRQAITTLETFHAAEKNKADAARFELESAYRIAKMMQAAGDTAYHTWFKTTITDWEFYKAHPFTTTGADGKPATVNATDAPYSDYGAEADFTLQDEEIHDKFDYSTNHHHYAGLVADILAAVDKDLGEAEKTWRPPLDKVATTYGSFEWAAAATARVGSLYDSIRSGLDLVVPKYFNPKQQALLDKLQKIVDQLNNAGQSDKADQVQQQIDDTRDAVRSKWRETKDKYMEVCNQKMVSRYVAAALLARKYNVKNATVAAGVSRLAYFTDYMGDDKMKPYVEATPDPLDPNSKLAYVPGEFLQWRSGVVAAPPANGQPPPLPAAP